MDLRCTKCRLRKTPDILRAGKYSFMSSVAWLGERFVLLLPTTRFLKEHNDRYLTGEIMLDLLFADVVDNRVLITSMKSEILEFEFVIFIKITYCHIKSKVN